jgi:predicted porin
LAFGGLAQAQTSVVLYGKVDAALQSTNSLNGHVWNLAGSESGSRWGVRGTEALGNGWNANFQLESGFDTSTGALSGSGLFNRIATVGLKSNRFGAVDLGMKDSPMFNVLDLADPFGTATTASPNFMLATASNNGRGYQRRYSNQVSYTSPNFVGLQAQGMYALGESNTATSTTRTLNDTWGVDVTYNNGPLYLGAAYNRTKDGSGFTSTPPFAINSTTPHKYAVAAGSFDFRVVKLFGAFYTEKRAGTTLTSEIRQRVYWAGLEVPVTSVGRIDLTAGRVNDKTGADRDARQLGIGYFHDLSKRTTLYTTYGNIKNDNVAFSTGGTSTGFSTGGSSGTLNSNGKASSFDFGVVHRF